jgi:hypothetical protein
MSHLRLLVSPIVQNDRIAASSKDSEASLTVHFESRKKGNHWIRDLIW